MALSTASRIPSESPSCSTVGWSVSGESTKRPSEVVEGGIAAKLAPTLPALPGQCGLYLGQSPRLLRLTFSPDSRGWRKKMDRTSYRPLGHQSLFINREPDAAVMPRNRQ